MSRIGNSDLWAPPTYSGIITASAGAIAGDLVTITQSLTRTVKLLRLVLGCLATAAVEVDALLILRSALDTAGTGGAIPLTSHDSRNQAATASATLYTAAPTPGAAIGTIRSQKLDVGTASQPIVYLVWDFTSGLGQCPTMPPAGLVGGVATATMQIALNMSGSIGAGGSLDGWFEISEEQGS